MSRLSNTRKSLTRIGSYWTEHGSAESSALIRDLLNSRNRKDYGGLGRAAGALAGDEFGWRTYYRHQFADQDIEVIGPDQQARVISKFKEVGGTALTVIRRPGTLDPYAEHALFYWAEGGGDIYGSEDCRYFLWPVVTQATVNAGPETLFTIYAIPWDYNSTPYALQAGDRVLSVGIDYEVGYGALVFYENPIDLFPDYQFEVLSSRDRLYSPLAYLLRLEPFSGPAADVTRFFRESVGPDQLKKAVARAAGLVIIPRAGYLREYREDCAGVRYLFDWGSVTVPYEHTILETDTDYPAGYVVGGLEIYGGGSNYEWYHNVPWPETGMPLDDVCPFKGLTVPLHPIKMEAYAQTGSKLHVRLYVQGDEDVRSAWWGFIKQAETDSGIYLNDVLGLASLNDVVYRSGFDLLFSTLLGERSLVVDLRLQDIAAEIRRRALDFLHEHRILGSNLIILDQ